MWRLSLSREEGRWHAFLRLAEEVPGPREVVPAHITRLSRDRPGLYHVASDCTPTCPSLPHSAAQCVPRAHSMEDFLLPHVSIRGGDQLVLGPSPWPPGSEVRATAQSSQHEIRPLPAPLSLLGNHTVCLRSEPCPCAAIGRPHMCVPAARLHVPRKVPCPPLSPGSVMPFLFQESGRRSCSRVQGGQCRRQRPARAGSGPAEHGAGRTPTAQADVQEAAALPEPHARRGLGSRGEPGWLRGVAPSGGSVLGFVLCRGHPEILVNFRAEGRHRYFAPDPADLVTRL